MDKKIVMIMGVQRSGTNILRSCLEADEKVISFNEHVNNDFFINWFLRPLKEIKYILEKLPGVVLLKPISETKKRSLSDIFDEFRDYDLTVIWIYRDPINVYYSQLKKWDRNLNVFLEEWRNRNKILLDDFPKHHENIIIVKYEDLVQNTKLFNKLCDIVGINGKYDFTDDSNRGTRELDLNITNIIRNETDTILNKLDKLRLYDI